MGMVVRTNTMALNAYRQLGMNNSAVAKSLEKLASGFRINRAGDDAAGLAISEKMKAQITGLETASANAQDGISLIQTAEGNLSEVHDMLNRMVELATKSANGTYTTTERQALQDEVDQLLDEIDRISQSANFNGTKLLDGSMGLNTEAITIGSQIDGALGTGIPLTSAKSAVASKVDLGANFPAENTTTKPTYTKDSYHLSEEKSDVIAPQFTFNLEGVDVTTEKTANKTSELNIGKTTITFKVGANATDDEALTVATSGDATITLKQEKAYSASDLAGLLGKFAGTSANDSLLIGSFYYKAEVSGTTVTFKATGYDGDNGFTKIENLSEEDKLSLPSKGPTQGKDGTGLITFDPNQNSGSKDLVNHDMYDVVNPQAAVKGGMAGMNFKLDENIVKDGNRLTIDGKTFIFKTDAKSDVTATGTEILVDVSATSLSTNELKIEEAVAQMSQYQTANFNIMANSKNQIHIEQLESSEEKYTSLDQLKALFSARGADTGIGVKVSIEGAKINDGDKLVVNGETYTFVKKSTGAKNEVLIAEKATDTVKNFTNALNNNKVQATENGVDVIIRGTLEKAPDVTGAGLTLQIGDTADSFNKMNVQVANMSAEALGLKDISIMTEGKASDAIASIKTAINSVSSARAGMGALQNRLEHTINNLDVAAENLSAANSRIRDTDMAKEMMNYTKMNVLVQSAQAMLAQANQQPQSVLQLLQ